MKIFIGADHNGFELKQLLVQQLIQSGHELIDVSGSTPKPDDDFPQFAEAAVRAMRAEGNSDARGILICGSGQGMCMAANRFKGIRASLVWSVEEARASRNDDDSNVLCLPARYIDTETASRLTECWLSTPFAGATRYKRRIRELDELS